MSVRVVGSTSTEIRKWAQTHNVSLMRGCLAQLLLIDCGDPIAVLTQRPVRLFKNLHNIGGIFILNDHEYNLRKKKNEQLPVICEAAYIPKISGFIYTLSRTEVPVVLRNSNMRYLDFGERQKVRETLVRAGVAA